MKFFSLLVSLLLFWTCTKTIGQPAKNNSTNLPSLPIDSICFLIDNSTITYTNAVKNIFLDNCMPCHQTPGSGNINLDSYQSCADLAKSGQLIPIITSVDPNNLMMPPSLENHLDSCKIKALNLWLKQGCPLN